MVNGFLRGRYKFDLRNFAPPSKIFLKMAWFIATPNYPIFYILYCLSCLRNGHRVFRFGRYVDCSESTAANNKSFRNGVVRVTWHTLNFTPPETGMAKARNTFGGRGTMRSIGLLMNNYPPNVRGQGHMTHLYILGPRSYLWSGWS